MKIKVWNRKHNVMINTMDIFDILSKDPARILDAQFLNDNIIRQFTGLKDKNGKEIYEGDILREEHDLDKDCMYDDVETYMRNHIVRKVPGYFTHDEDEPCSLILNTYKGVNPYVEVIGNIYENPDLIDPNDLV